MKLDMHMHSLYSYDSNTDIATILAAAKQKKLDGISITDHNSFEGSKAALKRKEQDLIIIPGAEYSTELGHLLVYFLKEGLEQQNLKKDARGRFSSQDIIGAAHEQKALVFMAHPFVKGKLEEAVSFKGIDGIEAYNSRAAKGRYINANLDAMHKAIKLGLPVSAGSDAHDIAELGHTFIDIGAASDEEAIKNALLAGSCKIYGSCSSSIYKAKSQLIKCKKQQLSPVKPVLKLFYFGLKEAGLKLGLGQKAHEGIYTLSKEGIIRHDFD